MLKRLKRSTASDTVALDANPEADSKENEGGIGELFSTIVWALGIAFVLRTFIFQPFTIPSASMYPGLMEGDYIITSKFSVGYGKYAAAPLPFFDVEERLLGRGPKRGDVVVFRPEGITDNFIKRVVGLPGDRVEMIDGRLHLNGEAVPTELIGTEAYTHIVEGFVQGEFMVERLRETFPNGESHDVFDARKNGKDDNVGPYTIPPKQYFMMGDNRDYSGDSRVAADNGGAGLIPASNIIGRAEFVLLSVDSDFELFKPWTWANMRGSRFFKRIS